MEQRRKTKNIPLWGMVLTTALVLGGLYAFHWWTLSRASIYEQRAKAAVERGDWEQATALSEKAEAAGAADSMNELAYSSALALLDAGEYAQARDRFAALGAYEDASRLALKCTYRLAEQAEAAGDLDGALQGFLNAAGYEDALIRADECRYALAELALQRAEYRVAFQRFLDLGSYRDAPARARAIAVQLTEEPDEDLAMMLAQGYTAADWEKRAQLKYMHESLASHRLAAGHGHAVFLTPAGTVRSMGENGQGQCDTDGWTDVTAVDAGYAHTLGLTADGRVLATGDNSCGQCDVSDWTGVVRICCGPWDSFGLTADGALLHCGFSSLTALAGWTDVVALAAGDDALFAVRQNGSLLSSAPDQGKDWQGLCGLTVARFAPVGLKEDGTLLFDGRDLSRWTDVVAIDSSATLLIGLRLDGTLLVEPLLPVDEALLLALQAEHDVNGLAVAGTFVLLLHKDGTLTAPGADFDPAPLAADA